MEPIIYYSTPPPWKSGGSQVEQWESGLVRVTQDYMVPRAERETIAASNFARGTELTGVTSPATDSIYIYPDPTITDENNGFSKISVSAYGRVEGSYSVDMTYLRVTPTALLAYYIPEYRIKWITVRGDSPLPDFIDELKFRDNIYLVAINSESVAESVGDRYFTYEVSPASSYGNMQEQVLTMTVYPYDPAA